MNKQKYDIYQHMSLVEGRQLLRLYRTDKNIRKALEGKGDGGQRVLEAFNHGDPFWAAYCAPADTEYNNPVETYRTEWLHAHAGGTTLFPEAKDLVAGLCRSKFSIQGSDVRMRWNIFSVAVPRGTVVDGITIRPFLFYRFSSHEHARKLMDMHKSSPIRFATNVSPGENMECAALCYQDDTGTWVRGVVEWETYMSLMDLPEKEFAQQARLAGQITDALMRTHMRLAASMLVFIQSFPGRVRAGLPEGICMASLNADLKHGTPGKRVIPIVVEHPIDPITNKPIQLVRGHFMLLKHERYTKTNGGEPRMVWRCAHERGGPMDPYTLTKKSA